MSLTSFWSHVPEPVLVEISDFLKADFAKFVSPIWMLIRAVKSTKPTNRRKLFSGETSECYPK